jgi:hypothetical protein
MLEPQIARRCPTCGASIREVAHFCPQCGNELPPRDSQNLQPTEPAARPEDIRKDTAPLNESEIAPDFSETVAIPRPEAAKPAPAMSDTIAIEQPLPEPAARPLSDTVAIDDSKKPTGGAARARPRGRVGAQLQRATSVARNVEGDVLQRVNKVRKISGVVIDEAGYDPSLRFVLVAALVFGIFLVIVLLNKLIT